MFDDDPPLAHLGFQYFCARSSANQLFVCACFRYINDGGETALEENENSLEQLERKSKQLEAEKEAVQSQVDSLKNDISKQQVLCRSRSFQYRVPLAYLAPGFFVCFLSAL